MFVAATNDLGLEQGITMRLGGFFIIGLLAIGAGTAQAQDAATQEKALEGTYTQNQACKGNGSDPANKLVVIHEKQVDSNFGPCTFGDKTWSGKVLKTSATCKNKTGTTFDVSLEFTLKDDNTVGFVEESSQYKSTLYRCPNAAAK